MLARLEAQAKQGHESRAQLEQLRPQVEQLRNAITQLLGLVAIETGGGVGMQPEPSPLRTAPVSIGERPPSDLEPLMLLRAVSPRFAANQKAALDARTRQLVQAVASRTLEPVGLGPYVSQQTKGLREERAVSFAPEALPQISIRRGATSSPNDQRPPQDYVRDTPPPTIHMGDAAGFADDEVAAITNSGDDKELEDGAAPHDAPVTVLVSTSELLQQGLASDPAAALSAIRKWTRRNDAEMSELLPALQQVVGVVGLSLAALSSRATRAVKVALEQSHETGKLLVDSLARLLNRDEQLRAERSEAMRAMLHTKMELVRLHQTLVAPKHISAGHAGLDAALLDESLDGNAGLTRAMHTLTKRMLESQERWEAKKAKIEEARARDFAHTVQALKATLAAAQGDGLKPSAPSNVGAFKHEEFMNRGSSVINRALALQKAAHFVREYIGPAPNAPPPRRDPNVNALAELAAARLGPSSSAVGSLNLSPRTGTRIIGHLTERTADGSVGKARKAGAGDIIMLSNISPSPPPPSQQQQQQRVPAGAAPPPRAPPPSTTTSAPPSARNESFRQSEALGLRADAVTEASAIVGTGELHPGQPSAVMRLNQAGENQHVLFASPLTGGDFRKRFSRHA